MSSALAIVLYLLVIAITLVSYYFYRKYAGFSRSLSKVFLSLTFLVPVTFASVHYSNSPDYAYYLSNATDYAQMSLGEYMSLSDGGFAEIARWVVARAGNELAATPYAFFALYAVITVIAYLIVLAKYRDLLKLTLTQEMLIAAFIFIVFYLYSLAVISQMAAVPIFLIALSYLLQKKYATYVAMSFLAMCFHASVLIASPLAWIVFIVASIKTRKTRNLLLGVLSLSVVAILFSGPLISFFLNLSPTLSGYDTYFTSSDGKYNNSMGHIAIYPLFGARLLLLIALWLLFIRKKMPTYNEHLIFVVAYSVLCVIMFIPSPVALLAGRIGYFFDIFMIMAVAVYAGGDTGSSLRAKVLLIAYCAMYFVVFYGIANWAALFPLDFVWNHPLA